MSSLPELSAGCLHTIIAAKQQQAITSDEQQRPLVQILATKKITNGSIRCVLFDGINTFKNVVLKKSSQIDGYYETNRLEAFSVVRLDQFWVSSLDENDVHLIIVSDVTPFMKGSQINRKLETFPPISGPMDESEDNTFNPNYRPPNESHNPSAVAQIDKSNLCRILDIHPLMPSFVIRVRVMSKSSVKPFTTRDNTAGRVFSFDVRDESSEIQITAFNRECDKYLDLIEKDLIYYISNGSIKIANKKYSNLKSDYGIVLTSDSIIELCDESVPLPPVEYNFIPIKQLNEKRVGSIVDVIGVITAVDPIQKGVAKKTQKEYQKKDVLLLDKTLHEVILTLWGEVAETFTANVGQVMAIKNAMVGEFRGKNLSCGQNSVIDLDPALNEAYSLMGWYSKESRSGHTMKVVQLSKAREDNQTIQLKHLCQINQKSVPVGSVTYFNCKATIVSTNRADKHLYKSCGLNGCMKKVKEENGFYFCEKCGNNSSQFEWRLMLSISCGDSTADHWVTVFQEVAEKIVGKSVSELSELFESNPNEYQNLVSRLLFKSFIFKIGSRVEEYNNEKRVKSTCFAVTPIDTIQRSKKLIQFLKSMTT